MGGRIWFESEEGVGSIFHFTVCVGLGAPVPRRDEVSLVAESKVLVVDDHAINRRIIKEILKSWQMSVEEVADGYAALEALERAEKPFDLVLMDLMMPGMDGLETVARIRASGQIGLVPVLLLSSAGRTEDIARTRQLGIARCLIKPVKESDLLDAVLVAKDQAIAAEDSLVSAAEPVAPDQRRRVLLADDGLINQQVAVTLLEERGHSVVVVDNGRAAVEKVAAESFDLVLMDVQMPEMDGIEATLAIRAAEAVGERHMPIIAMTAHAMKGDRERFLASGMDGYVAKPVRPVKLYEAVEGVAPTSNSSVESSPIVASQRETDDLPFRWETALERVDGREQMLRELVDVFFAECPKLIQQIRENIDIENGAELRRVAHMLKGSADTFGADGVSQAAYRLEQIGRAGEFVGAEAVLGVLEGEVERLVPALKEKVAG